MPYLLRLYEQGLINGVKLNLIPRSEALKMEPTLAGCGDQVIYSPTTCVMDIQHAMKHISATLPSNVELVKNASLLQVKSSETSATCYVKRADSSVEHIETRLMINAAGLNALDIAHSQGLATDFRLLPLKGRYAISKEASMGNKFKMLIYPVPVEGAFALGVHSTLSVNGHVKLGPTVFPAFSPENYDFA